MKGNAERVLDVFACTQEVGRFSYVEKNLQTMYKRGFLKKIILAK